MDGQRAQEVHNVGSAARVVDAASNLYRRGVKHRSFCVRRQPSHERWNCSLAAYVRWDLLPYTQGSFPMPQCDCGAEEFSTALKLLTKACEAHYGRQWLTSREAVHTEMETIETRIAAVAVDWGRRSAFLKGPVDGRAA